VFAVTAFLGLIVPESLDTAFRIPRLLGAAASLARFSSSSWYFDRPSSLRPQEINGRPNFNMGRSNSPP